MDIRPFQGETAFHTCKWKWYFPFMCYHIALIPLLKTVQKDVCLESGRNALPTTYTRVKTRLCTWSNTTTQTPLDSVGMQPHREQPQATNLMDLLCDQLGTTKWIPITEGQGPLEWTFADLQPGIARMTKKQPIKIIVDNLSNPFPVGPCAEIYCM